VPEPSARVDDATPSPATHFGTAAQRHISTDRNARENR
jgi:hypothetical protein